MLKIRILKSSPPSWCSERIGEVFAVDGILIESPGTPSVYVIGAPVAGYVPLSDAQIVTDEPNAVVLTGYPLTPELVTIQGIHLEYGLSDPKTVFTDGRHQFADLVFFETPEYVEKRDEFGVFHQWEGKQVLTFSDSYRFWKKNLRR